MPADAYQGHVSYGAFRVAAENPDDVAPADSPTYDNTAYADQPGEAARQAGYPRSDGQPAPAGAR